MQLDDRNWEKIRKLFNDTRLSTGHFAIATVTKDGTPHVSPIGSLFLRDDMSGYYFEELVGNMARNLKDNNRVCVMAVRSGRWFWLKSLISGRFSSLPALRLGGRAGEKRQATAEEIALLRKFIRAFKLFKGYDILWSNMTHVRDIVFDSCENINAKEMTYRLD